MLPKKLSQIAQFYQQRFGFKSQLLANPPHPNTQLIITIPCFNEPNLIPTLQSLLECYPTTCQVEVIVGINAGEHVAPEIHVQNQKTKLEFIQWNTSIKNPASHLRFQVIDVNDLPAKHAGAGLARKVVMDEALYRFAQLDYDGGIVCLDADCLVSPNYLTELERAFVKNTHTQSAALYFEHPYQHEKNQQLKAGISNYELHLRYYIQGLRYAQFPYALHTVGSSMAVRASTYALTGGMNRRKAGEDFYFMHKMMPQGDAIEINSTCVFPSCRMSDRVPFGTGRAQNEWMKNEEKVFYTYHPQIFTELKHFLEALPMWYQNEHTETLTLPPAMQTFLQQQHFLKKWEELNKSTKNYETFYKRFFHWFDGFKVLKFVHFARDHYYNNVALTEGTTILLDLLSYEKVPLSTTLEELLGIYRRIDRGN